MAVILLPCIADTSNWLVLASPDVAFGGHR
jgi:hypothetical protein